MFQARKDVKPANEGFFIPANLLHRCVSQLLAGTASSLYFFDEVDHAALKQRLARLSQELAVQSEEKELLFTVGKAVKVLDLYNQRCSQYVASASSEMRHTIKFLLEMLLEREFSEESHTFLREAQKWFFRAHSAEELHQLQERLEEHLLHPQAEDPSADSTAASAVPVAANDNSTGLRGRASAIEQIGAVIDEGSATYGASIHLDCLSAIESRYGLNAAQDFLNAVAHSMVQSLQGSDAIFHWGQHCLFALMHRSISWDAMTHEVQRLTHAKKELLIDVGGRTVVFAVVASTDLFYIPQASGLQAVVERIDRFAKSGH